jgi:hypothetical protein
MEAPVVTISAIFKQISVLSEDWAGTETADKMCKE